MSSNVSDQLTKKIFLISLFLLCIFLFQVFLYRSYVIRELSWSPYVHDDETWYIPGSYTIFENFLTHKGLSKDYFKSPNGFLFFLQPSLFYIFFGASRLTTYAVSLFYYILWQAVTFLAIYKLRKNFSMAFMALGMALLIPGPAFLATLTYFGQGSIAQAVFWIFTSLVIGSNSFLDRKWSMAAGIAAGLLILFRYYYTVFLVPIYFLMLLFFVASFIRLVKRPDRETSRIKYLARIKNIIISGLTCIVVCGYFLWLARGGLYTHYGAPTLGSKALDYLGWGQGAGSGWAKYSFYLLHGLDYFSRIFWIISIVLLIIAIAIFIIAFFARKYTKTMRQDNSESKPFIDFYPFLIFIISSLIIPYFILTEQVKKAGSGAGVFLSPVYLIIVISIIFIYNRVVNSNKNGKITHILSFILVGISLSVGLGSQIRLYSSHAKPFSSLEIKRDMMAINKMYDDIGRLCEEKGWYSPAISVDNWVWYLYGTAWNLKTLHYERCGVMLEIQPRLGKSMFTVDENNAMGLIKNSNIAILGAPQKGIFPVVEADVLPKIWHYVKREFIFLESYSIEGSLISVYYKKDAFTESSSAPGHFGYRAFDGSVEPDDFWHAGGSCPQWVQLEYPQNRKIIQYRLKSGYIEEALMPKDWEIQGSNDGINWEIVDKKSEQTNWNAYETREYMVTNPADYRFYKFYFTKGNRSDDVLRIYEIEIVEESQ